MTNGDWIRSMTDQELAIFIRRNVSELMNIVVSEKYAIKVLREWLSSPREEL